MLYKYLPYFIEKQNVIPVCVSSSGLNYIDEKNITLKELPSDHYMLTPRTIKQLGININSSTIEAYTQAQPQEIHSFIKCVLPKHHKRDANVIRDWNVQKRKHNQAVKYEDIFYSLVIMLNITPWNEPKFPEMVQRIYNALFVSVCQICLTRTKRPRRNLTWINDLNYEHQKELSKEVDKMQVVPLGPKRVKLSEINNFKRNWQDVQPKVNN